MKKPSIKVMAAIVIILIVVLVFSSVLYANNDSPLPLNPDPEEGGQWYSRVTGYQTFDEKGTFGPYSEPLSGGLTPICDSDIQGKGAKICLKYVGP